MDELRKRIDVGLSATIGGCHFSPILTQKRDASSDKEENRAYRLFRETGRHLRTMSIGVGDEVVFAGCWLVKSRKAGILHALSDAGKAADRFDRAVNKKYMPKDWRIMPHRARQAIPVLTTLDGGLIYPQIGYSENHQSVAPIAARFLGMAKNPVFFADTPASAPC